MISASQLLLKRSFDLVLSLVLLPILILPILFLVLVSTIETGQFGIFSQVRVGQHGKLFRMYKIRCLKQEVHQLGRMEQSATVLGKYIRRSKLDELPQLFNVILGDMSFVGPRPDVVGYADTLEGNDRIILKVKPGITGPATLKYKNEDFILAQQSSPETYNRTIIWVDKVEINKKYVHNWSFYLDLTFIIKSIFN